MARKFLDARPDYSDPLQGRKTLNADTGKWGAPMTGLKSFDAAREWTGPVLGMPLSNLPVGTHENPTLIKYLTFLGDKIVWEIIGRGLETMKSSEGETLTDVTTMFMNKIVALRCFDAVETNRDNGYGMKIGNYNWGQSNLRQWTNSSASAGNWYKAEYSSDKPPELYSPRNIPGQVSGGGRPYVSDPGMLFESTQFERDLAIPTLRTYSLNNGIGRTSVDKFFPLTVTELYFDENTTGMKPFPTKDGVKIPYFANSSNRVTKATESCIEDIREYLSDDELNGIQQASWPYWTITGYPKEDMGLFCVSSGLNRNASDGRVGVRLACNLPSSTMISVEPDKDGCYTVLV